VRYNARRSLLTGRIIEQRDVIGVFIVRIVQEWMDSSNFRQNLTQTSFARLVPIACLSQLAAQVALGRNC
jgi:hypothetical protein